MSDSANDKIKKEEKLVLEWDQIMRKSCPEKEDFSLKKWIRTRWFYMIYHREFTKKKFKENMKKYRPDVSETSRLYRWMFYDALDCYYCYGADISDYFLLKMYEKNHYGKNMPVTIGKLERVYRPLNGVYLIPEIDSKYASYQTFRSFYKRELILVEKLEDGPAFHDFLKRHKVGILKPNQSSGGAGVVRVTLDEIEKDEHFLEQKLQQTGAFTLEELVVQDERMAYFNESSVNTVRMEMIRKGGRPEILFCFCRYGKPGSLVDNVTSGGGGLLIDQENGVTFSNVLHSTRDEYTGNQVIGIQIPEWEVLKRIAIAAAEVLSDYRLVALDFALSKEFGWIMIEANTRGGFHTVNTSGLFSMQEMEEIITKVLSET